MKLDGTSRKFNNARDTVGVVIITVGAVITGSINNLSLVYLHVDALSRHKGRHKGRRVLDCINQCLLFHVVYYTGFLIVSKRNDFNEINSLH